jgi:hypothetical protein
MVEEHSRGVVNAFRSIGPDNPLKKLNDLDRKYLWALLVIFDHGGRQMRKEEASSDSLERLSSITVDAAKLAKSLRSVAFKGPFSEAIRGATAGYEDLPMRLTRFSERLEKALGSIGKPGHKRKTIAARSLVEASEFVRLKIGQYYDEHVAELFQAISGSTLSDDFSGDAIRKKRERLKRQYPVLYANALQSAKSSCHGAT